MRDADRNNDTIKAPIREHPRGLLKGIPGMERSVNTCMLHVGVVFPVWCFATIAKFEHVQCCSTCNHQGQVDDEENGWLCTAAGIAVGSS